MLGVQCFNLPNKYIMFKNETVEAHMDLILNYMKIPKDEVTFKEDVWAGGGNLGPCMEFFVGGMEVGNMVFMQ